MEKEEPEYDWKKEEGKRNGQGKGERNLIEAGCGWKRAGGEGRSRRRTKEKDKEKNKEG